MKPKTRSILEELNQLASLRSKDDLVMSKGEHIIDYFLTFVESINKYYTEEEALYIEKKLLGSLRNHNSDIFKRGVKKCLNKTKSNV